MTYPLPSGWQQLQIKDVCLIYYGKGLGKNNMVDGNIPVYSSGGIIGYHNESIVNSQGVIIGRKGNAGSVFYSSSPFFCIDTAFYVEANNNINLKFLYYKLIACKLERYKIDSAVPGINRDTIYSIFLTIPPLEEQKHIAEVLSLCDDIIENLTELIEKKEQYKKGIMQRLLSGEVRFKGFTDEWQKYKLLDIGISYSGLTNKNASNFIDNCNAKYVTYKSIYDSNKIDINRLEDVFVEKDEKQNLVQYGDAFFTISSETPDEVAISSVLLDKVDNTYLNSFCFGFRFDFNILLPEFARYYFRSNYIRKYTYKLSQGSTRFNLSKNKFLEMIINIPSIEEQKKIAGLLSVIDEEIENLKKQLELRKQQKKGLMQKLLTGEVRI